MIRTATQHIVQAGNLGEEPLGALGEFVGLLNRIVETALRVLHSVGEEVTVAPCSMPRLVPQQSYLPPLSRKLHSELVCILQGHRLVEDALLQPGQQRVASRLKRHRSAKSRERISIIKQLTLKVLKWFVYYDEMSESIYVQPLKLL
jgi:hypothetical protein